MIGALVAMWLAAASEPAVTAGISEALAQERGATLRDVRYDLAFTIPADRRRPLAGRVIVRATLATPHRVVLDFDQPRDHLGQIRAGNRDVPFTLENGHIAIPASATSRGENVFEITFTAG